MQFSNVFFLDLNSNFPSICPNERGEIKQKRLQNFVFYALRRNKIFIKSVIKVIMKFPFRLLLKILFYSLLNFRTKSVSIINFFNFQLSVINRNRRMPSDSNQMLNSIQTKQVNKVKPNVNRPPIPDGVVVSPSSYNRYVKKA